MLLPNLSWLVRSLCPPYGTDSNPKAAVFSVIVGITVITLFFSGLAGIFGWVLFSSTLSAQLSAHGFSPAFTCACNFLEFSIIFIGSTIGM